MRTADGHIISQCLNGNSVAFGFLVDKYKESVYALAYSILHNFHDAEDVAQEAFLKAYRKLHTLKQYDRFHAWLFAITSNLCKNQIRSKSRQPDCEFIEDQSSEILESRSLDQYREELLYMSIHEALESLPETYCQALTLHYLGGMKTREIAEFLGTTPDTIKHRLARARADLKEEMLTMMGTTFEMRKLPGGFTFRILESVKHIQIHPLPRTAGLPWGLSVAAGVIFIIMGLSSYTNTSVPANSPTLASTQSRTQVLKTGEIPVDIIKVSQMLTISSDNGNSNGRKAMSPKLQNEDANAAGVKLVPDNVEAGDRFGSAVYIYGDYIIAGAPWQDDQKGAAYIFKYDGTSWREQAMLVAKDGESGNPGDVFGSSVVITDDCAIVGAPYDDDMGENTGSVYIFRFNGGHWVEEAKLRPHGNTIEWCSFGDSISISGDYLIVGSPYESSVGGAIYIFQQVDGKWEEQAKLISSDWAEGDIFGSSVSISGDHAIVGADGHPSNKFIGSAYIFRRIGDSWKEQAILKADDGEAGDQFGFSVSISGNYAIVGANNDKDKGEFSGSAYIFHYDGTSWKQQAKLISSDLAEQDSFGGVVNISGNYALVGASNKDGGAGAVYAFLRNGTVWGEKAKISLGNLRNYFGNDVFISGNHAVIGSPGWNDWAGGIYIYNCITDLSLPVEPESHLPTTFGKEKSNLESTGILPGVESVPFIPTRFRLLQNYPNPFNPETWIPYQLAEEGDVVVRIYSVSGQIIRTLNLGYRTPGSYIDKAEAAYWDGANEVGESVASDVYFYTIQAGDFTATRKMVVAR